MNSIGEPQFGCQNCASPNPRDDQLCVDCMRAKLSYLNSVATGLTQQNISAPKLNSNRQPAFNSGPFRSGLPRLPRVARMFILSPSLLFILAFIMFFMLSGKNRMMNSYRSDTYRQKANDTTIDPRRNRAEPERSFSKAPRRPIGEFFQPSSPRKDPSRRESSPEALEQEQEF